MPAIVRVKRRIDEEPLGAFVLNGKKRRLDNEASNAEKEEISTVLKFAGTTNEQDDKAISHFARLSKDEAKELVKQKTRKPTNHTERARQEMRQSLHENRFRVVQCLRTTLDETNDANNETANAKEITIVDIEKQHNTQENNDATNTLASDIDASSTSRQNAVSSSMPTSTQPADSDTGYVYDLYIPENEQQADYVDLMENNYLSVRAFDDLVYEDRFHNEDDDDYDSEDSNQENCAGNDYPDEEDDFTDNIGSDESDTEMMRRGVEQFVFDDNDEDEEAAGYGSSSDDDSCRDRYKDPYVNVVDVDEESFVDDVDYCDADRYGLAYARYKARILKKLKNNSNLDDDENDDEDEDSEERYHSASEN